MAGRIVGRLIWIILNVALWVTGLILFIYNINYGDWLIGYLIWGGLCTICTFKSMWSSARGQGKSGRARGANTYSVTDNGSHYTVQNHPVRGAIIGFLGGLIGGFLVGPVIVPIIMIKNLVTIGR